MAQTPSRSSSPRTETVACASCQRTPCGRGPGAGASAITASGMRRDLDVFSLISVLSSQELVQPRGEQRLGLGRAGRLLRLGPAQRRPDLDAVDGAGPGRFLDETRVLAQTGRNEDPAQPVNRALLRGSDEGANQLANHGV